MSCITTIPSCNFDNGSANPLGTFAAILGAIGTVGSVAGFIAKLAGAGAATGGALAALAAAIAVIVLVGFYAYNRCSQPEGRRTCIAGCVSNVRPSFSEAWETVLPFAAWPNRVDITVKSFFWGFVEEGNAYVYCNDEPYPRTSEILHTYYYSSKLCAAETGAQVGVAIGAAAGVIAAIVAAAAIGCATIILCILAILLAIIIAVVAALLGAFAGGNIARAVAEDNEPSGSGPGGGTTLLKAGQFVTQQGNMINSEEDNNANVFWWVASTTIHGEAAPGTPQPFSYCEIDEQFMMDACPRAVPPIG